MYSDHKPAERFFTSSLESKLQAVSKDKSRRGYSLMDSENFGSLIGKVCPNDTVEKFRCGPWTNSAEKSLDEDYYGTKSGRIYFFENTWNGTSLEFQTFNASWYNLLNLLSLDLLSALAIGLGFPASFFTDRMTRHTSIMSINYYAALGHDEDSIGQRIRVAEHTDVSLLTLVHQSAPGLQIRGKNSEDWFSVDSNPESIFVHVGDCLQYWSKGIFKSTVHRVISDESASSSDQATEEPTEIKAGRISMAYFATPNYDTLLEWPTQTEIGASSVGVDADVHTYDVWRKKKIAYSISIAKRK